MERTKSVLCGSLDEGRNEWQRRCPVAGRSRSRSEALACPSDQRSQISKCAMCSDGSCMRNRTCIMEWINLEKVERLPM